MNKQQAANPNPMPTYLRRAGGLFILLFLMAGQGGQEIVQASFLLIGGACLAAAEWWPLPRRISSSIFVDPRL